MNCPSAYFSCATPFMPPLGLNVYPQFCARARNFCVSALPCSAVARWAIAWAPGAIVDHRPRDVRPDRRREQRDQLHLCPVDVPAGEVRVLRVTARRRVDRARVRAVLVRGEPGVLAVRVTEDVRMKQGVVERRV